MIPNYYNVLEIAKDATSRDIKKSFKKMAMLWCVATLSDSAMK